MTDELPTEMYFRQISLSELRHRWLANQEQQAATTPDYTESVDFARLSRIKGSSKEFKRDNLGRFARTSGSAIAKSGAKRVAARIKDTPDYNYKPSDSIKKMMANKRTSLEKLDDAVAKELTQKYRRDAMALVESERDADTPKRGSKNYESDIDDVAIDLAAKSYAKDYDAIWAATDKNGRIELPNSNSLKVYDASFVQEYEVEDADGEIKDRGFFFTKKDLDGIVKKHS